MTDPSASRPSPRVVLLVALGGALGAVLRSLVPSTGDAAAVPWPTLAVNVGGSLSLGLLVGVLSVRGGPAWLRPALGTGVLGGFTTFSLYATETAVRAVEHPATAAAYALLTVIAAVGAAAAGLALGRGGRQETA